LHTSGGDDRWVWSNGGMMISRGKLKELGEKLNPVPLHSPWSNMKSSDTEPGPP
jgi:hypothetical protein